MEEKNETSTEAFSMHKMDEKGWHYYTETRVVQWVRRWCWMQYHGAVTIHLPRIPALVAVPTSHPTLLSPPKPLKAEGV